jgi:transcriptional regulator with XRE-family HTH domain
MNSTPVHLNDSMLNPMTNSNMHTFAELLKWHREQLGWTQHHLADKMRFSRNSISAWERGEYPPRQRDTVLQLSEVLMLSNEETDRLLRAAQYPGLNDPFFIKDDARFSSTPMKELAEALYEWKAVHSRVQSLFINIHSFKSSMHRLEHNLDEKVLYHIESRWIDHCEPQVQKVIRVFRELRSIQHGLFHEFETFVTSDHYVIRCIWDLRATDIVSAKRLQQALSSFAEILDEILIITDLSITQIAEELKGRQQ